MRQLEQHGQALHTINKMVHRHGWVFRPQVLTVTLKIVQEQAEALLVFHARNQLGDPGSALLDLVAASEHLFSHLESTADTRRISFARRNLLEVVVLYLIHTNQVAQGGSLSLALQHQASERRHLANVLMQQLVNQREHQNALWLRRCRALLSYSGENYAEAQRLFAEIRQGTHPNDPQTGYYWWEARYYGLDCLAHGESPSEARRIAQMVLQTYPEINSPWKFRLRTL